MRTGIKMGSLRVSPDKPIGYLVIGWAVSGVEVA
jgi:hypothetical protein